MSPTLIDLLAQHRLPTQIPQPGQRSNINCPECGHRNRFSLTIDADGRGFVGRCNRVNSCGHTIGARQPNSSRHTDKPMPVAPKAPSDTARASRALAIWDSCSQRNLQPLEGYLLRRGILISVPQTIRWHSELRHPTGQTGGAMVAAIQDSHGQITAVQRTWIDGEEKADLIPCKMSLGPIGDGAVRLALSGDTLALAEGVEDALSLIQMSGVPTWACLGVARMKSVAIPGTVKTLILAPDADDAAAKAVTEAYQHFTSLGLKVLHLRPPAGADWNSLLPCFEERAAIREFEGGLSRTDAETSAFAEIIGETACNSQR
ncbi:toprim domain-containing protein [Minwuia sp. IMCC3009]|uniref:DUF7146 domain-containing protein n=1 Tax=Minwuia sp. IMCC3009 TaxID=3040674 RepID=UPI00247A6ADB|nr:toprim domain-containing protein [Minwuia sp. IMCC3009]